MTLNRRDAWRGMRNWFIRTEPRSLDKALDVPVGDDTPARSVEEITERPLARVRSPMHVGDDTPAPTAQWTVHRSYGVRHVDGDTLWCHDKGQGPSPALATLVADALNRVRARTPDLDGGTDGE